MDLSNRASIFKHLAPNDLDNETNKLLFSGLLEKYYSEFIEFCDHVRVNVDKISSVSCYLVEGQIHFLTEPKE